MTSGKSMFLVWLVTLAVSAQAQLKSVEQDDEKKMVWGNTLTMEQNYPNPFLSSENTIIDYHIAYVNESAIIIYNAETKKPVLEFRNLKQGGGELKVSGQQLQKGNYIYALIVNGRMVSKRRMRVV